MKRIIALFIAVLSVVCLFSSTQIAAAETELDILSKSGLLMDYASGEVLYEKDAKEHLPVASMVKMMTILLALEEYESGNVLLDSPITTTENASGMGGSQVFIDPYVEYRFEDLLKSVIIASANDASVALAEYFSGTEKNFVAKMNKRAKELGMTDTNYVNCTGLPSPEQYSCAKDSAIVMREILKHEIYHNYSSIWLDELVHPSGRKTELTNTNRLIRYYNGCDGGKTGSTNEAGCCLTASASRDGMRLISVIVGAQNSKMRFNESSALLNYGFNNFENKVLVNCNEALSSAKVEKGKSEVCNLYAAECYSTIVKKGDNSSFEVVVDAPEKIYAPLKAGEKVGKVLVTKDGNVVKEIDVVTKEDVSHISYFDSVKNVVAGW